MTHTPNDVSLRPEADGVPGNGGAPGGGFGGVGATLGGGGRLVGGILGVGGILVGGGKLAGTGVPETSHTPPSHCASLKHDLPLASAFTTPRDTPVVAIVVIIIETNAIVVVARGH